MVLAFPDDAVEQLIQPDRNELVFHRQLVARCKFFPVAEFRRSGVLFISGL
jgi:hypothetical protein